MTNPILVHGALFCAGFAVLAGAVAGQAQDGPAIPYDVAALDRVTVTATRRPVDLFTYPGAVSVLTRAEMDDLLPSSTADLFDQVPGVEFGGGPRRTGEAPSVRGLSGAGVAVLIDGVRQSFLSGHDGRFFVDPDLLATAEVVRGPFSALYGSGALGGVIAFRTLDAADLLSGDETKGYQLKASVQDVNEETTLGVLAYGRALDGRLDGLASFNRRAAGDISLSDGTRLPAEDEVLSGLVKGSYSLSSALKLEAGLTTYRGTAREPNNGQGVSTGDIVDKDVTADLYRLGAAYTPAARPFWDLGATFYFAQTEVAEAEIATTRRIARAVESYGFSIDNHSTLFDRDGASLSLIYGADILFDDQTGTDNTTPDGTRGGVPDAEAETYGLFLQAKLQWDTPLGEVTLIPALRGDRFKTESADGSVSAEDSSLSPKIGLSYRPWPQVLIFANYAEAFRAPSFDELYADDIHFEIPLGPGVTAANSFIPNPGLKPEKSRSWEVGAGLDLTPHLWTEDRLLLKGSYFESSVDDLIDLEVDFAFSAACFAPVPGPCTAGTSRYANAAEARLQGAEAELSYEAPLVFVQAGFASITGRNKASGGYVGVLAPDRGFLTAGLKLPGLASRLGARAEIAGRFTRVNSPADERDSYEVVDVFYVWAPAQGPLAGLRLDLGVDNVFGAHYERVFAGVAAPDRNFKAALRWRQQF